MCRRAQASDGADAEGLGAKSGEYFPAGANSCQRTPAESGPCGRSPVSRFVALKPGVADQLCACGDEGLADGGDQRAVAGAVDRVAVWAGIVLDDETILRHGELDEDLHRIARRVPSMTTLISMPGCRLCLMNSRKPASKIRSILPAV